MARRRCTFFLIARVACGQDEVTRVEFDQLRHAVASLQSELLSLREENAVLRQGLEVLKTRSLKKVPVDATSPIEAVGG